MKPQTNPNTANPVSDVSVEDASDDQALLQTLMQRLRETSERVSITLDDRPSDDST